MLLSRRDHAMTVTRQKSGICRRVHYNTMTIKV